MTKDFNKFISINNRKNLYSSFKMIRGVNSKSLAMLRLQHGFSSNIKIVTLTYDLFLSLNWLIEPLLTGEKDMIFNNVLRKKKIKSYSGMRHILRLPVRGQRTHTNAQTSRRNIIKLK